jgi:molecular chaperone DnaK (HSP70)/uncharacterized protein (DUF697 family)
VKDINLIGIDFGTTNSCVCFTRYNPQKEDYDEPRVINFGNDKILRTALLLDSTGNKAVEFGETIYKKSDYVRYPERVREEFKINIGNDPEATRLTTWFFQNILSQLTRHLGVRALNPANEQVIVGVPAQWTLEQQAATRQAAQAAGFPAVETAPEPVGAMLYHYFNGDIEFGASDELTLVIDFGGGTTDFVVVKTEANGQHPVIVRTYGQRYGGRDFDQIFFNYIHKNYWRGGELTPQQRVELLRFARKFKEDFSLAIERGDQSDAMTCLIRGGIDARVSLALPDFQSENMGGPIIDRFAGIVLNGLQKSHLTPYDIRRVILTGGSARWYFVKQAMSMFQCPIVISKNPEQTIAKGLSLVKADLKPRAPLAAIPAPMTPPEPSTPILAQLEALGVLSDTELKQCRDKARRVIWNYAATSGGAAILLSPIVGSSLALAGLEAKLVMDISKIYGYDLKPEQVGAIIGGLLAGGAVVKVAVNEALTFVPGIGWVAKGGVAAVAVKGLGELAIKYFENARSGRANTAVEIENGNP